MCRLIHSEMALWCSALSAAQLPFEPNPCAFATYLGKEALVMAARQLQDLSGCSMGSGNPKLPVRGRRCCADQPSGYAEGRSPRGATRIIWTAGKTGGGSWQGNVSASLARRRRSALS